LLDKGYHAGLHLGRWYPNLDRCFSVAVTEKRTRAEIDGLVSAFVDQHNGARNGEIPSLKEKEPQMNTDKHREETRHE
jgi:hypothetical protein